MRLLLALAGAPLACSSAAGSGASSSEAATGADLEARTSARLDAIRDKPDALAAFVAAMPKGADLHTHLSGAVYAESYLEWARGDGLCVNTTTFSLVRKDQCAAKGNAPIPAPADPLYASIVAGWSMQDFHEGGAESGHDHFFNAFGKFFLASTTHAGDMLAEATDRAAEDHVVHVEPMVALTTFVASKLAGDVWAADKALTPQDFPALREALLAHASWGKSVADAARRDLDDTEARRRAVQGCDGASPRAGCRVDVRYVAQVTRTRAPHEVFAQVLAAFEIAAADPRVVGVNLSAPEDNTVALRDYDLHMQILDFLVKAYDADGRPRPHVALHAGELARAFLPNGGEPDLHFHIRRAVEVGHAERIGHGVSIRDENASTDLLGELAERGILIEACLSSNAQILDVSGPAHPLPAYLAAGVPVALATDDQGISRGNMRAEYTRAIVDIGVTYKDLKRMARRSVTHAFLPGASLWASPDTPVAACDPGDARIGGAPPSQGCQEWLAQNPRGAMEYALEVDLAAFEREESGDPGSLP